VRASLAALGACHKNRLQKRTPLSVEFQLAPTGTVAACRLSPPTGVAKVDACVLDVFRGLSFPPTNGGNVDINYPLLLIPSMSPGR
jgi:hypothetical protein